VPAQQLGGSGPPGPGLEPPLWPNVQTPEKGLVFSVARHHQANLMVCVGVVVARPK